MKIKVACESVLAGVVAAVFSSYLLHDPVLRMALALRREAPDAWFSGLITFYAEFVVLGISLVVAIVVFRKVYKHAVRSDQKL